jgi:phosphoglycolate phosphatase
LFDLDGTLARTFIDFPAMRAAMRALSARHGTASATAGEDDILEIVAKMAAALGGADGARARAEAYAVLAALEAEGCAHPEPVEGAAALLRRLRGGRGLPVAIITRNCRAVSEDLLHRLALEHDLLVAREDVAHFKPHPEPVLHACRAFGVAPADAVMVGDLWADVAAGRAAGTRTVGIQWPHDPPDRFARCRPDIEVPSLLALAACF